ncbi:twin-arginine translocase TatA/TatE family subunit [uncultured Actinomyces sp.]|uniref:twin-arginine translocase TatA/TatE family subunit n=1 Tax=uncultured Actinomyces sp. TaxID=249061 RepID=UPI00261675CC|nr:twin-arginine translocase TatA/TatE family subunit [uncultured Actinomyces sp.]
MFGINGNEFIVILLVAVIVVGPRRLPEYTRKLTQLIRQLRVFLEQAKAQIAEEVGPELGDLNLADLNPRNYDPRKIVRDALGEDLDAIKRDLANPLAAVASTAKEASDAVAADVRALAAQERSDSLGKRIEAQAEAARAGAESETAQAGTEAAQGAGAKAEEARGAEAAQGTGTESETARAEAAKETRAEAADVGLGSEPGTEEETASDTTSQSVVQEPAVPGTESPEGAHGATAGETTRPASAATGPVAKAAAQAGPAAGTVPAGSRAEVADVVLGPEPSAGEESVSDTASQAGSAETASAPQDEASREQDATDQEQTAAPDAREQAVVAGSRDGRQAAASEAAAIPTSLTEASSDLPPRPLSPRDIVRAAKAAARTRPEVATLTVDA